MLQGPDPACYDQTWLDWNYAFLAGEEPNPTVARFAYMLQGGSDASNTDPFATEPAAGEEWVNSGPHVMLLLPGELDLSVYSTDHDSGGPYIVWAGTPYEHIMTPVAEATPSAQRSEAPSLESRRGGCPRRLFRTPAHPSGPARSTYHPQQ